MDTVCFPVLLILFTTIPFWFRFERSRTRSEMIFLSFLIHGLRPDKLLEMGMRECTQFSFHCTRSVRARNAKYFAGLQGLVPIAPHRTQF